MYLCLCGLWAGVLSCLITESQLNLILRLTYHELRKIVGQSSFDPKSLCHFRPKHKSAPPCPPPPVKTNKVKQLDLSCPPCLPPSGGRNTIF